MDTNKMLFIHVADGVACQAAGLYWFKTFITLSLFSIRNETGNGTKILVMAMLGTV